jgi:hypothetical protein
LRFPAAGQYWLAPPVRQDPTRRTGLWPRWRRALLAPVVYVFVVVLGGLLSPDYSHASRAISELIEVGAPNKWLLNPLFALYNLLTGTFAVGLFLVVRTRRRTERRLSGLLGALVLVFEAFVGLVTVFFPQDPPGSPPGPWRAATPSPASSKGSPSGRSCSGWPWSR